MSSELRIRDPAKRSMLLTALYIAQEQYGYLSPEAIQRVASRLGLPVTEVYSMASFYSLYRTKPTGRYVLQVCEGLSCHLVGGAESLVDYLRGKLGIEPGQTTKDGLFSIDVVACIGACGLAPVIAIDGEFYAGVTVDAIPEILNSYRTPVVEEVQS